MRSCTMRYLPRFIPLTLLMLLLLVTASAQQDQALHGSCQAKDGQLVIKLTLSPDGSGTLDNAAIKYEVHGASFNEIEAGKINNYSSKQDDGVLEVSGGDVDSPLTFSGQGSGRGLGGRRSQPATET